MSHASHPPLAPDLATAFEALVEGRHSDPFAVLGPHGAKGDERVTAFVPGASRVEVIGASSAAALPEVEGYPGLFSGPKPVAGPYRLRVTGEGGAPQEVEDPYRFGPVLGELDEHLLGEGSHARVWQAFGAHVTVHEDTPGTHFAVWAPNAMRASVVGDFNAWDGRRHAMRRRGATGVWEIFLPGIGEGAHYKYELLAADGTVMPLKADPVGFGAQHPPETASVVRDLGGYGWDDRAWMQDRATRNRRDSPISVYEVHLGSWTRREGNRPISYVEAAQELVAYVAEMGFTHIELMPISEHPFDGSWGYQPIGLFAPTIRHGPPQEFRDLVDAAHQAGLGVILDWVPAHFPTDAHGLGRFDGTALYEHADPREGFHQDWNTLIYNYGRTEVANFLTSNALYWLEEHHVDGLRVDAVASMLYRDYSRADGQWVPNKDGGRENYEAMDLLRRVNTTVYREAEGIMTVAEESTAFPKVSAPVDAGGLGFGYKWNMGWMNDALDYMGRDPVHRRHHHHQITFGLSYAFSENFILPISHDEVVHGKGSMLRKMPGSEDQQFANLRAFYGMMWGHPGKKLLFMGQEFAQPHEWNHNESLDWALLHNPSHAGIRALVRDLNRLYRETPALHAKDCEPEGFRWLKADEADISVFAWLRQGAPGDAPVAVICNMTPVEQRDLRVGLPVDGEWREVMNTDAAAYGGEGRGNFGAVTAEPVLWDGQPASAALYLPPLSAVFLRAPS